MTRWAALFFCAVVVALALRLPLLENRPMHNDEAVNAVKFGALWDHGDYRYDPHEYHGPTLHYLTAALCGLTNAPDYVHLTETRLRLCTALSGICLVLLLLTLRDELGGKAMVAAAVFTAVSPVMVFYSRYWIHESWLVLFSLLAIASGWRFIRKPSWTWAFIAGAGLGLMQATKETFVLMLAAAVGSWGLNRLLARTASKESIYWRSQILKLGFGLMAWLAVWLVMFTSFFQHAGGLFDSIRTYAPWLGNAGTDSVHAHEWSFYLRRLYWFQTGGGPVWSEAFLLGLGVIGGASAFLGNRDFGGRADFIRWLAGYTILLAAIYCAIPYKTPWCVMGFHHGVILLAGVGAVVVWGWGKTIPARVMVAIGLGLGTTHLAWQAWCVSFVVPADRSNPWVYAHTSTDLLNLVAKVTSVTAAANGDKTQMTVIGADDDYWPLPWYLRQYSSVGWWNSAAETNLLAPLVIASGSLDLKLDARGTHIMVGYFQLRPQVFLEFYVERALWLRYLAAQPDSATDYSAP
jgi:uncharacterized protein (TIGR03663 family)